LSKVKGATILDLIIACAKFAKDYVNEPKSDIVFFYLTMDDAKRLLGILEGYGALPELRKQIKLGLEEMEKE